MHHLIWNEIIQEWHELKQEKAEFMLVTVKCYKTCVLWNKLNYRCLRLGWEQNQRLTNDIKVFNVSYVVIPSNIILSLLSHSFK